MSDAAYRDEEAALIAQRAQLLATRREAEAHAASRVRIGARRMTRAGWGGVSSALSVSLLVLDVAAPDAVATPTGGTMLGRALVLGPLAMLAVFALEGALARRSRAFVVTSDVRADIDRLRAPPPSSPAPLARIEAASFALPLVALALWMPLAALHGAIDLAGNAPRFYEMEAGPVLTPLGPVASMNELLVGGAIFTLLSVVAYAIAIHRAITRARVPEAPGAVARGFGGLFFGALLGQLASAWMEQSASSVALGYASLALGAASGMFGARALFAWVVRVRERERRDDEAPAPSERART